MPGSAGHRPATRSPRADFGPPFLFALSASRPTLALAMDKTQKHIKRMNDKSADLARGWEIHFGLPFGSILTREQLLDRDHDLNRWISSEHKDGFLDERTLPHGLLYMTVDTALKVCLQTGHPDSDPMVVGWYWDSFSEKDLKQGVHSTPEWDEIEDGESLFDNDGELTANGMPCWNADIYDRFEDHSRQGYMGLSVNGPAPQYDVMRELDELKKITMDLANPYGGIEQDIDEHRWAVHFRICRIKQLLAGKVIR